MGCFRDDWCCETFAGSHWASGMSWVGLGHLLKCLEYAMGVHGTVLRLSWVALTMSGSTFVVFASIYSGLWRLCDLRSEKSGKEARGHT